MKKTLTIIILCLVYILIYLLQLNFFNWFTIAGVKPNLFVILVLFIGLFTGRKYGAILGIIFGLGIDLLGNNVIGQTAVILGIIGFLRGIPRQKSIKRQQNNSNITCNKCDSRI